MMQEKCLACHGREEEKIKGGLDLRTLAGASEGGDSLKPSFVAGKPGESPLYLAVTREHVDWKAMPPKENDALNAEQRGYLAEWITAGAPWPTEPRMKELLTQKDRWSADDGVPVRTSGGLSDDWTNRRYKPENLWAYRPLRKPTVPVIGSHSAGSSIQSPIADHRLLTTFVNPIDAFIGAKLSEANLIPAPLADRRTLIRRATFDLTGLPPTPAEVTAFVADPAPEPEAFAKVTERLLASPHYGEQWGRHWLDVVRYADSSGLANDFARGPTWRYRDYVIRAFNADKPYDRFIREQIAGDEIAAGADEPGRVEALVATGFLRMGPWELTAMEVPKVARQKFLDDVTDSVGQVFLAHPLQCARCHDHKFDPIPTRDYYSLQAVFATTQMADQPAPFLPEENVSGFAEREYLTRRQEHYRRELARLETKQLAAASAWYAEKAIDAASYREVLREVSEKKASDGKRYQLVRAALQKLGTPEAEVPPQGVGFSPEDFGHARIANKGLERLRWELDRYEPIAFAVYGGRTPELTTVTSPMRLPANPMKEGQLEDSCVLTGGDPFAEGAKVTPAVLSAPSFLGEMGIAPSDLPVTISGRRRALADWIASPQNPLAARVMVNRIWGWHFGTALAGNPNNFGATGKKPTHPELLDWLAATFVDGGSGGAPYSIKAMHRLIMSSEAYRRGATHPDPAAMAKADPGGASYAVFKPRRLRAEEMRDAMLAVSGELNPALGGVPARPEINLEAALQPRQVMGTFAEAWQPSPKPSQRHRRSVYALKVRGLPDPFMEVFNSPSPDLSCEARDASTVTPQVFSLFNGESTLRRAIALAVRVRRETPTREAAIERMFQLALGRAAAPDEHKATLSHWERMTSRHGQLRFEPQRPLQSIVRDAVEENTGEKFRFSEPLEAAADFEPDLGLADVPPDVRGLAEVGLVLLNSNEFAYIY